MSRVFVFCPTLKNIDFGANLFVFDENFGHGQVFLFVLLYTELYYLNIIRNIMEIKMNLKQAGVLTIAVVWSLGVWLVAGNACRSM